MEPPAGVRAADAAMTDGELLAAFRQSQAPELMAEIVARHTARVYSICHRVLRDAHAAEDATQATFLTLFQKAPQLSPGVVLAGWLYVTAQQAAMALRRTRTRAQRRDQKAGAQQMGQSESNSRQEDWSEAERQLDPLLAALSAPQRDAILLCYFYGHTHAEAAREIGCPEETLRSRLKAGIERLREKFRARGFVLSESALTAMFIAGDVQVVPYYLKARLQELALGRGTASAEAVKLAQTMKAGQYGWHTYGIAVATLSIACAASIFLVQGNSLTANTPPPAPIQAAFVPTDIGVNLADWEFIRVKGEQLKAGGETVMRLTNEDLVSEGLAKIKLPPQTPAAFAIELKTAIDKMLAPGAHVFRVSVMRNGIDDDNVHPDKGTTPKSPPLISFGTPFTARLEFRPVPGSQELDCRVLTNGQLAGTRRYDAAPDTFYFGLKNTSVRCFRVRVLPLAGN